MNDLDGFTPPPQTFAALTPAEVEALTQRLAVALAERDAARRDAGEALRLIEAGVYGEAIRFIRRAAGREG